MTFVGFLSRLPPTTWNAEHEQCWQAYHCAPAAATFIGWYFASTTPSSLPTSITNSIVGSRTTSDSRAERLNTSVSEPRRRCQAETASTTAAAVATEASSTWAYPHRNTGLVSTAQMLLSTGRPVCGLVVYPTGCCIHEFAAMMNAAER